MRVSYYGTKWVDLAVGLVVFSFGKSGVLIVLYVMIADMSDLRWRALCSWGMDWGIGVSVWSAPLVGGFIRYITAPSAGRLYFSIGMPLAVAVVLTTYVFLQKAKFGGFIPEVAYSSKRRWWSIMGVAQKILHTAEKLDIIGISLWTLGSGLFLSSSLISYECKIWEWRLGLVLGGALFTALFIVWELHLNELVRRAMSLKLARNAGLVRSDMSSKNRRKTWFFGLAASGRDTPPAMGLEQWENSHKFEFGGPKQPLIRLRLIRSRSISLGALVGFLANFVLKIGIYSEGDPVGLLPTHKEDVGLNARIFLQNMAITSKIFASLIVALYIRSSQKPKCLVVTGLVIILISIVAICFIGEPGIFGLYRIVPQILFGIGAGFAWIGLLVRVQSGCSQHTDVAMATALLVTCNKLGDIAGGIVKRIIKASLIKYLAHGELAQVDDPTYSGWAALLATTVSVAVFNIFLAAFGLEEIVIGEMKQKVSGVIFGIGDPLPKKGNDTGDSTSQDPRTFYTPTTSSDGGAQQHRRPCNLAVGEVSIQRTISLARGKEDPLPDRRVGILL
ncbi:hypothetical protein L873DRAFT_567227 [Choiromyces venosus 120613-1]|uniref:MFS general substrate transporter n=1 Tax=Choiromyces venosus 120613-1 TaxID=1336337 RepID=A0A3N4JXK3_9PEZI|nr:hypothetical protein L873DRAFT_567227 [Choiromyces venosus 120613-1]